MALGQRGHFRQDLLVLPHAPQAARAVVEPRERARGAVDERLVRVVVAVQVLQARVGLGDVVALVVDVADGLPVDRDLLAPGGVVRRHDQIARAVGRDLVGERRQDLGHRRLLAGLKADEDEALPQLELDRLQPPLHRVERRESLRPRGAAERPVEVVAPGVERADDGAPATAALVRDDARPAVAADVVEGADHAVAAAHDERALAGDVEGHVVAGLGQLALVAGKLPGAAEEELLLELEHLGVGVAPGRETAPVPPDGYGKVTRLHAHGAASDFCLSAHSN